MKRPHFTRLCLAIFVAGVFADPADADSFHEIADQARVKYAAAQQKWQNGVCNLTARMNPAFREIAWAQRDLQLATIEERTARFRYLLAHDPHRIVLTNGIPQFANFEWTDSDAQALAESDPSYVALHSRVEAYEKRNNAQAGWQEFRAWCRETLSKSKEHKTLLSDFMAKQKEVEALLQQYKPD